VSLFYGGKVMVNNGFLQGSLARASNRRYRVSPQSVGYFLETLESGWS